MRDALDWSVAPVIFSHSGSRGVYWHRRSAPDDVLYKLKNNGGLIMVVSTPSFVGNSTNIDYNHSGNVSNLTVKDLADHIDYINSTIGYQHIGVGSDFDGMEQVLNDMQDVSKFPNLFNELNNRGYSQDQILDIKGRNLLRVMKKMEQVRDKLQKTTLPDETWISQEELTKFEDRHECRTDLHLHPKVDDTDGTSQILTWTPFLAFFTWLLR